MVPRAHIVSRSLAHQVGGVRTAEAWKGNIMSNVLQAMGAIAATESKDIVLPAGTFVRVRFDSAAEVRRS